MAGRQQYGIAAVGLYRQVPKECDVEKDYYSNGQWFVCGVRYTGRLPHTLTYDRGCDFNYRFDIKPTAHMFDGGHVARLYVQGKDVNKKCGSLLPIQKFLDKLTYTVRDEDRVAKEITMDKSKQYWYTTEDIGSHVSLPRDTKQHRVFSFKNGKFEYIETIYSDESYDCLDTAVLNKWGRTFVLVPYMGHIGRPKKLDGSYKTKFGPCVYHEGEMLEDTPNGLAKAFRRLSCAKGADIGTPWLDCELAGEQRKFTSSNHVRRVFRMYRNRIRRHTRMHKMLYDEIGELVDETHPKKGLRINAFDDLLRDNKIMRDVWNDRVKCKVKRAETAKPRKYTRPVCDLTTEVSLMGARLAKMVKMAMAEEALEYAGCRCTFVDSPKSEVLDRAFHGLIHSTNRVEFIYYSDDSCLSVLHEGKRYMYNMDISSCDSSHTVHIFNMFTGLFEGRMRRLAYRLVEQLKQCLILDHGGRKIKLKRAVDEVYLSEDSKAEAEILPTLYSGSVLTTAMNNLANMLIFLSICESDDLSPEGIVNSAKRAGYIVTLDECKTYHKLQFLKHSPVMTSAGLRSAVNLGVFLRSYGQCFGDLPGRKNIPLHERARRFNSGYIKCFKHGGSHPLVTRLGIKNQADDEFTIDDKFYFRKIADDEFEVPVGEICMRYGITNSMYYEMCDLFDSAGIGDQIDCYATRAIIELDYGLCTSFK